MTDNTTNHQTYTELPLGKMGFISPDQLNKVAHVADKYGVKEIKLTSGQKIALLGLDPSQIPDVWQDLDLGPPADQKTSARFQNCPGPKWCRYGLLDPMPLAAQLNQAIGQKKLPAKIKIGISACPRSCSSSYLRDLGFLGLKKGWTVIFGGNGGGRPRIGDVMGEGLTDKEAITLALKLLDHYRQNGKARERTARFCQRLGPGVIKTHIS